MLKLFGGGGRKYKTLIPLQAHGEGKRTELSNYAQATLGTGDMSAAVRLPRGEDLNEWLAVNTVDFFNEINLLYGTISEYCTAASCPKMVAGAGYEYHWMDGDKYKEPVEVSAPEYVELLMNWVDNQLTNEQIFPLQLGSSFPKDFVARVQKIFQRLFRVYAHVYHKHFERILELHAEAHLNTCFKHFIYFANEFKLLDESHTKPLKSHIDKLTGKAPADESKDST